MKLTNPTDDELNAAFAEKVAGWTYWQSKHGHFHVTDPDGNKSEPAFGWPAYDESTGAKINRKWTDGIDLPPFTESFDAVLPWLPKTCKDGWWNVSGPSERGFFCEVTFGEDEAEGSRDGRAWGKTPTMAVLLALLGAHGVEVEFTK